MKIGFKVHRSIIGGGALSTCAWFLLNVFILHSNTKAGVRKWYIFADFAFFHEISGNGIVP